jgi:light-regulated signal transduction histidine kinase (bacteriophytochrome)
LPDLVLTVGTLMACLVALTVYLGYTAGLQARELQSLNTELEERVAQRTADLRGANRALRIQTQELARSNDDLQQFAYVASHDLQEPLRMVSSYVQLIQRRYEDKLDEEGNEFMNFAVDGAERMRSLIKDLLAYARLDTGGKEHEPISGDTALRAALKNLELVIEESGAELETAPLPTVLGNQGQLTRLFQNLIGNAIKFKGDRNPLIRISADLVSEQGKQDDELPELIRLSQKDAAGASIWHFTVTDNGIGIDPNFKERIFVIFQRLHGQGQYPGTGIGLAICKKIVQRHGGRIWVESDPGKGSTFHFTLREPPSSPFET